MSDSQSATPLSVEDIAEAWLDVQLTRVDGANEQAAKRVLALVNPRLQHLARERDAYADGSRKGAALAVMLNAYGLPAEPKALARRIEQERAAAEKQRVLLGTSLQGADATIKTLYTRIAELEAELAAAKADGVRVAEEAREAARIALEERRAQQGDFAEIAAAFANRAPDTERTPGDDNGG